MSGPGGRKHRPSPRRDVPPIASEPDEPEPEVAMTGDDGGVVEQDPGCLAGGFGRGEHGLHRVEIARVVEPTGNAEAVRQVRRADEQDVDAIDRGDLRGVLDSARQSIWMIPRIRRLMAGMSPCPRLTRPAPRVESARPRMLSGG